MTTYVSVHASTIFSLLLVFAVLLAGGYATGVVSQKRQLSMHHVFFILLAIVVFAMVLLTILL